MTRTEERETELDDYCFRAFIQRRRYQVGSVRLTREMKIMKSNRPARDRSPSLVSDAALQSVEDPTFASLTLRLLARGYRYRKPRLPSIARAADVCTLVTGGELIGIR